MSDRAVLYFELLQWLEVRWLPMDMHCGWPDHSSQPQTISNHEALASMMAMPIMVVGSTKAVIAKRTSATRDSTRVRERTILYEGSSGPRELLEAIVIQAQAALKGLEGTKVPELEPQELTEEQKRMTVDTKGKSKASSNSTSDENQRLLDFCRRILATANGIDRSLRETKGDAFVDRLHASLPSIHSSPTSLVRVEAGTTEASAQKAYMDWAVRVRFEYCDLTLPGTPPKSEDDEDETPHFKFYYNDEARMLANSDIPKRSLAIAKEVRIDCSTEPCLLEPI